MRSVALLALVLVSACGPATPPVPAAPDVHTRELSYEQNGVKLQGLLAWDENAKGKRPGVLVVHEWWGHDEHARNQAKRLAESGYVGLALDMYGDTKHTDDPEVAGKLAAEATKDPTVVVARFNAARAQLASDMHVDANRIAAIGYCFGGSVVLNMARAGQDLDAVASFHGLLQPALTAEPGTIRPQILVLTGADDSFVPADMVEAFKQEMATARASHKVVVYPGAKHSFTNPKAESHNMAALAYNADADRQSWQEMLDLFGRVFR